MQINSTDTPLTAQGPSSPYAFTIHPLAEKFPALSQKDFDELKESIRKFGLFEPIVVNAKGQVLDGRHRYRAVTELSGAFNAYHSTLSFEEIQTKDKPLTEEQFIYDSNMKRRHLTESQRSAIAAEFANMCQGERTDLEPSDNCPKVSQERAGELFNVSSKSVSRAKKVKAKDPKTFAKVKVGDLSLNAAVKSIEAQEKTRSWSATDKQEVFNAGIKPQSTRNVRKDTTFEDFVLGLFKGVMNDVALEYPDKTSVEVMSVLECHCHTFLESEWTKSKGEQGFEKPEDLRAYVQVWTRLFIWNIDPSLRQQAAEIMNERAYVEATGREKPATTPKPYYQEKEFYPAVNQRVQQFLELTIGPKLQKEQAELRRVVQSRKGILNRKAYRKILSCLHPDKITDLDQKEVYAEAFLLFTRIEKLVLDEKDSPTQFINIPKTPAEWEELKRKAATARKTKRTAGTIY